MPGGGKSAALQRRVVAVEGGGFCVMVEKLDTLALKDLDVVLAQPVGGVGVEEVGVLIPLDGQAYLATLAPILDFFQRWQVPRPR